MKRWMGIDPGASGGLAVVSDHEPPRGWKMPATEKDLADLFIDLSNQVDMAVIERVHAFPHQGVSSCFTFGQNYGFLRGMLIAYSIPFEEATPQKWQRAMGCLTHGDKNISKAKAQQLFPKLRVIHATADALLLAEFCRRLHG